MEKSSNQTSVGPSPAFVKPEAPGFGSMITSQVLLPYSTLRSDSRLDVVVQLAAYAARWQAPPLLEKVNITTARKQKFLRNLFILFCLIRMYLLYFLASSHALQLSECALTQILTIGWKCLRQKPNESSCSDVSSSVQSDRSLLFENLAGIQMCQARLIQSEKMPLSSKASQPQTEVVILEDGDGRIRVKKQSMGKAEAEPRMLLLHSYWLSKSLLLLSIN